MKDHALPSKSLFTHAEAGVEAMEAEKQNATSEKQEKPKRKRAPKKPREGLCRGMLIKIEPSPEQEKLLRRWTGMGRLVWNWGLARQNEHYQATRKHLAATKLSLELTPLLEEENYAWLREAPRTCLTKALSSLGQAWKNFFDNKVKGTSYGKPHFHKRGAKTEAVGFQVDERHPDPIIFQGNRRIPLVATPAILARKPGKTQKEKASRATTSKAKKAPGPSKLLPSGDWLSVPGLGLVKCVYPKIPQGLVAGITIRPQAGGWQASLSLIDIPANKIDGSSDKRKVVFADPKDPAGLVALDGSIPKGAVAHNGYASFPTAAGEEKAASEEGQEKPTSLVAATWSLADAAFRARQDKKLEGKKRYQRSFSRKAEHRKEEAGFNKRQALPKGILLPMSNRQQKALNQARQFELSALFARQDRIHKFTTDLVRRHHTIVVETLALTAMARAFSRGFRRRFHEAAMGEIRRQLVYKCKAYGRELIFVDRYFPSSQLCSTKGCGFRNKGLKLKDTAWVCPQCNTHHDRDENAAINLWQEGWRLLKQSPTAASPVGSTGNGHRARKAPKSKSSTARPSTTKCQSSSCSSLLLSGMEPNVAKAG